MAPSTAHPPRPAQAARRRLAGLDGLRALAALGVVVLHVSMFTQPSRPPWSQLDTVTRGLHLGVALFFVLSGFLLFRPWVRAALDGQPRPALGRYALRRVARIAPAYWLSLAGAAVLLAGVDSARMPRLAQVPILLVVQQNVLPATSGDLVPPAWTLGIEVCFYAALPLIGWVALRCGGGVKGLLALCAALVAAGVFFNLLVALGGWPGRLHGTLPGRLYAFGFGMAVAVIAARCRLGPRARGLAMAVGTALVAANAEMWVPLRVPALAWLQDSIAALGFASVVLAVAGGPQRLLGTAPLRWLGERSYGLYLWHFPIIAALSSRGRLPETVVGGLLIVLPLSLLAAELSWRLVERPAMNWARAAGSRRAARAEPKRRAEPRQRSAPTLAGAREPARG